MCSYRLMVVCCQLPKPPNEVFHCLMCSSGWTRGLPLKAHCITMVRSNIVLQTNGMVYITIMDLMRSLTSNHGSYAFCAPSHFTCSLQIILALVAMVFNCPGLTWSRPTDHLELFAGVCAITRGEVQDTNHGENS